MNSMAYPPTSLDFINRPNPVEPHAVVEKHPLDGPPRLEQTAKEDFLRVLLDDGNTNSTAERPFKRQKAGDATSTILDLPKLPAVKNGVKRMRIPPILRGLHQPPPDAGLLPSISIQQPVRLANATATNVEDRVAKPRGVSTEQSLQNKTSLPLGSGSSTSPKLATATTKQKRKRWSDEETADLLKGVARFGIGNWTRILKCPDYEFNGRTAIDIKDRFRICCPTEYKNGTGSAKATAVKPSDGPSTSQRNDAQRPQPAKSERKAKAEMKAIGIDEPFERSKRRPRKAYTAEEDAALLAGLFRHGNSWAAIQNDPSLRLSGRTPTDLRDRLRTKHPERYRELGLALRPETLPKTAERPTVKRPVEENRSAPTAMKRDTGDAPKANLTQRTLKENQDPTSSKAPKSKPATSILQFDDVFWGAPLDEDDTDFTRPTLDRQILDWPFEPRNPAPITSNSFDSTEPIASRNTASGSNALSSSGWAGGVVHGATTLPSLADITAGGDDLSMHMELPTLVSVLESLEEETSRGGGQIPSLEDLLS